MERVALVVEATGERLPCLLNPESLTLRRAAGVRPRDAGGGLAGPDLRDDPLLFTGGGRTELELDLLFDIDLDSQPPPPVAAGTPDATGLPAPPRDVRDLTGPLWQLAENHTAPGALRAEPRIVRFVWGRAWNVPGVVTAVAERLERFSPDGHPARSWLRLRLLRVDEPAPSSAVDDATPTPDEVEWPGPDTPVPAELVELREPVGSPLDAPDDGDEDAEPRLMVRPDLWSQEVYDTPFLWRLYATFSGLDDPLFPPTDRPVRFPPRALLDRGTGAGEAP
ncbi:MAG: hypothetical protein IPM29_22115 [Planctomycetes bacterium]|nr:hypothetical protein [Planctomycetota bacterium]